ncbi:MAG: hypothetical protein US39_C0001G0027 [Microgenomates group bacterium GW2011_GWC1_37_12b]|uniref:Uncharacterized protein n=1 Tax=Candidatus Woesebacteria bacterium GW2011_GWB1_38_8b TaxID=1618571 RepID=A0A0G0L9Q0_9BACT|nr:MAG: hypothetical protein US39_C0001G0027 [Microgenomates group bacterium GW2011_GWC1_37_12b]KKQ87722.1 MAG: hypothetical protein UT10_C0002G0043 [Candidatus Woesebacteria bacterium GW2011_GWB1_38_8b]
MPFILKMLLGLLGGAFISAGMGTNPAAMKTLPLYIVFAPLLISYPFVNTTGLLSLLFIPVLTFSLLLLILYWWLIAGAIEFPISKIFRRYKEGKKVEVTT